MSLHQPYATLIALGAKTIETRSRSTAYRGPIAIHATVAYPDAARAFASQHPLALVTLKRAGYGIRLNLPHGAIVAVATLAACHSTSVARLGRSLPPWWPTEGSTEEAFGDFSDGRYAWLLEDVRPLPRPVPCRGALGLWNVPDNIVAAIEAALGE